MLYCYIYLVVLEIFSFKMFNKEFFLYKVKMLLIHVSTILALLSGNHFLGRIVNLAWEGGGTLPLISYKSSLDSDEKTCKSEPNWFSR